MKKYWVVFNPETGKFENYATRGEAEIIAKALAVAQPTFEFVILEAVASVKQPPATKEDGAVVQSSTDKEKIAQLEAALTSVEAELDFAEQARDVATDRANKAEDKLEAIKQAVGG